MIQSLSWYVLSNSCCHVSPISNNVQFLRNLKLSSSSHHVPFARLWWGLPASEQGKKSQNITCVRLEHWSSDGNISSSIISGPFSSGIRVVKQRRNVHPWSQTTSFHVLFFGGFDQCSGCLRGEFWGQLLSYLQFTFITSLCSLCCLQCLLTCPDFIHCGKDGPRLK